MHPTPSELVGLRKGLKKRAVPKAFDSLWASQPGIGGFVFEQDGADLRAEWVVGVSEKEQPRKNAMFHELCNAPDRELERLELGWLIADLFAFHAQEVLNSIGGPNEAMREAAPFWKMADNWKHWALVPAGHMKFEK